MPREFALRPLLEHARHRLEAAERLMRMLKRKEDAAAGRLGELQGYLAEYRQRLTGSCQGGMDIQRFRDFHGFIAKLEGAIQHQEKEVSDLHGRWCQAREQWFELRRRVKSFEVLEERRRTDQARAESRREQRQFDELAGRALRAAAERGDSMP